MATALPKPPKARPAPKEWSMYRNGSLTQESDDWDELYSSALYWMRKGAAIWLLKNGSVTL